MKPRFCLRIFSLYWPGQLQGLRPQEQYQIGVYLPDDLKGFSIEELLANKVAKKWQVGFSGTDNGILLVVALQTARCGLRRQIKAAEALPDVAGKRILDSAKSELKAD